MKNHLFPVAIIIVVCASASAAERGYYSQPAIHSNHIVFVSEGDLWTAALTKNDDSSPIIAHRLTSGDGEETHPRISPDGEWVAFSGQYDGNTDVYLMPITGGAPKRLTFHPGTDTALAWMPDSSAILFSSGRAHPHGRLELWRVSPRGGMPTRYEFGPCSMVNLSAAGRRFAFTRHSNERWHWKHYRGGTAPDIWIGDFSAGLFQRLTKNDANDQFPMFMLGRVYFLSDRAGAANIWSVSSGGGDVKQHTHYSPNPQQPVAIEGYDIRFPSGDSRRGGDQIIFCQAADLAILNLRDDSTHRLNIQLASDRIASRQRFVNPMKQASSFALSPDGKRLILESRGELLSLPVESGLSIQLTRSSFAREWGASYLDNKRIVLITDANGEQNIAVVPADGSENPSLVTEDREAWLFPPVASPDGKWIAFGDNSMRLHLLNTDTLIRKQIDRSEAGEITDYRFSPDSQWLAYTNLQANGFSAIKLHSIRTGRVFDVSDGLHNDHNPRWDPAGKYLYFLSDRHLDPIIGVFDFEHVYAKTTGVFVVSLSADTPPPLKEMAQAAEFDLKQWANEGSPAPQSGDDEIEEGVEEPEAPPVEQEPMRVETDGLQQRVYALPIKPGQLGGLEALPGGVCYLSSPLRGLVGDDDNFGRTSLAGGATLHRFDLVETNDHILAEQVGGYALSGQCNAIAWAIENGFVVIDPVNTEDRNEIDATSVKLRVDSRVEWNQIFDEAWRLQRDFYWASNMKGVDWPAMKEKYRALLNRIGTRNELNDLIGEMIGELGTSHTYIWGGEKRDEAKNVSVGLMGADIELDGGMFRINRILPGLSWNESQISPLAPSHLGIEEGNVVLAINGVDLTPNANIHDLLQDQAEKSVRLTIADDARRNNERIIEVKTTSDERALRYAAWVDDNRSYVDEKSDGALGYIHIPNMGGEGLVAFSRYFYPQIKKKALVIDIRDNGGGFVSQMIIQRLAREIWAFGQPRHGMTETYPVRAHYGPKVCIIDQYAGSDGDIFPESFRIKSMGTLIGMRTWGGVIGIRADKPFVDFGMSTQPEFAWWEPARGWGLENKGVSPDIEVDYEPADYLAGRDPQLDKAIEVLMEKLDQQPKELPTVPALPE